MNVIYAEMVSRLNVREGQTPDQARKAFDSLLGVSGWSTPGHAPRETALRDPRTPWWWDSPEEASNSFLASMGVSL